MNKLRISIATALVLLTAAPAVLAAGSTSISKKSLSISEGKDAGSIKVKITGSEGGSFEFKVN